jgi:hypothetical protein
LLQRWVGERGRCCCCCCWGALLLADGHTSTAPDRLLLLHTLQCCVQVATGATNACQELSSYGCCCYCCCCCHTCPGVQWSQGSGVAEDREP